MIFSYLFIYPLSDNLSQCLFGLKAECKLSLRKENSADDDNKLRCSSAESKTRVRVSGSSLCCVGQMRLDALLILRDPEAEGAPPTQMFSLFE